MVKGKTKNIEPTIFKDIRKLFNKPPKLEVVPIMPEDKEKAKLLEELIKYNWGEIEDRFNREILRPMTKCMLYGRHKWAGYGVKDRHICRNCGWKTWIGFDPIYDGSMRVEWDKQIK